MRVEPFAVLFWALGIVLEHILSQCHIGDPSLNLWYWHGTIYGRGQLGLT